MKRAVAIFAAALCLSSDAAPMSAAEFREFRMRVSEVQSKLDIVQSDLDYLDSLLNDVYGTIKTLKSLLEKYSPDRWESVKRTLEGARATLMAEQERMTRKAETVHKNTLTVLSVCNEIEGLVAAGYKRYAEVDAKASQYLGALSSIPFNSIATKRDFAEAYGYFGFIKYDGWRDSHISIEFECGCRDGIGDSEWYHYDEFEAIKAAIDEYAALYASLSSDFEDIQEGSVPQ